MRASMLTSVPLLTFVLLSPTATRAHCDSLDGPVVVEAKASLEKGDVSPLLKWVRQDDEEQIRSAFTQTLAVRKLGPEARKLADRYFFETLVRIHRASEGAPYTGLKPAGTTAPVTLMTDEALAKKKLDPFLTRILGHVGDGIRQRYDKTLAARQHKDDGVDAGRAYVAAYVEYVHYVERIVEAAHGGGHGGAAQPHAH